MIQFERRDIPLRRLASGTQVSIPTFRFTGDDGPRVYIQANIHGPEIAGCGAIYEIVKFLHAQESLHGTVTLVPSINPIGLDTKIMGLQVGYMDLNDPSVANWNRIYPLLVGDAPASNADPRDSAVVNLNTFVAAHQECDEATVVRDFSAALRLAFEDTRRKSARHGMSFRHILALTALDLALDHDYVLDLHTAGVAAQHLYLFEPLRDLASCWHIPYIIQLPDEFTGALDEAIMLPWLHLQKAFKTHIGRDITFEAFGKECYTLELGDADSLSRTAMKDDAARIINYLRNRGVLDGESSQEDVKSVWCTMADYCRYAAPTGGFLLWEKTLGSTVQPGEIFATIVRPYAICDESELDEVPIMAQEAGILMNHIKSHVVEEGMTICTMMTNVHPLNGC